MQVHVSSTIDQQRAVFDNIDRPSGNHLLGLLDSTLGPLAYVFSLWCLTFFTEGALYPDYLILSLLAFALAYPSRGYLQATGHWVVLYNALFGWAWIAGLMLILGYATGYIHHFDTSVLYLWLALAPVAEIAGAYLLRATAPALLRLQGPQQRAIIIGMNEQGLTLAQRIRQSCYREVDLIGFIDSRATERLLNDGHQKFLGHLDEVACIVRKQRIHRIYISLPMASQPRILQLLDNLKDTTVSIYFVPDLFVTDLIQGQVSQVNGVPVISVCESPFVGLNGMVKRLSDVVISTIILVGITPILTAIATGVKLSSPGPIIFKQRRYGLEGEEILVYKFRSMRVTEDGPVIHQAQKNDPRITRFGAFLRRTSLDELPQFINVLQGRMSIVGPRPHAVAHNEMYRKLIKGYMIRHKVKPGITGWAQVNGYRGETDTLDKMQGRINFDLDYLRNWSLRLDLFIIFKTVKLVVKDAQAY